MRRAGLYLLLELLLPGGTLVALLLWFSSAVSRGHFAEVQQPAPAPVVVEQVLLNGGSA